MRASQEGVWPLLLPKNTWPAGGELSRSRTRCPLYKWGIYRGVRWSVFPPCPHGAVSIARGSSRRQILRALTPPARLGHAENNGRLHDGLERGPSGFRRGERAACSERGGGCGRVLERYRGSSTTRDADSQAPPLFLHVLTQVTLTLQEASLTSDGRPL